MIKTEFSFFQIPVKLGGGDAIELSQPAFDKAPERLDTIKLPAVIDELILAVIHAVILVIHCIAICYKLP